MDWGWCVPVVVEVKEENHHRPVPKGTCGRFAMHRSEDSAGRVEKGSCCVVAVARVVFWSGVILVGVVGCLQVDY